MALNFGKGNRSIAFAPTAAFPLNANSYFESYDLALAAALTAKPAGDTTTKYYFGQEIAVAEMIDNVPQSAKLYIIAPEVQEDGSVVGTLQEVGSATDGDGKSIELVDGVLSVKDFGKRYYKYVAAVEGGEAAHYEVTEGWVAGLEPKVVLEGEDLVIGWYEPNPTTAEGVKDQVVEVQGEVEQAKEDINSLDEILNGTDENPGGLVGEVEDIADVLYGTEGENPVPGLIEQVEVIENNLEDNYYTKSETYSKSEVDGLVSGVFHFEGTAESYEALPAEGNTKGDVYQVADKEYAWDGNTWVELGYVVDLSSYYTKAETDAEIKKVQDALDLAEKDILDNAGAIEDLQQADTAIGQRIDGVVEGLGELTDEDERLAGLIDGHDDRIEALETAKDGFDTHFTTVDGQIKALQEADTAIEGRVATVEGFETRIGTLESRVGSPSTLETALFPAVEALQSRIDGLVAVGGEANLINGLTINGTALTPNAERIVDLPIFAGSTAGLIPVVSEEIQASAENYYLNAAGVWVNPNFATKEYVDEAIADVAVLWSSISE